MISCSLISADKSERSGTRLNTPSSFLLSTSIHVGFSRCSASSTAAMIRACFLAFSRTVTTSSAETLKKERLQLDRLLQ